MEKLGMSGENYMFKNKWEIFESDCSIPSYGVCSWARRNFTCNFCKKEYKSAQALGGHMNVHRRDRARLRLSSMSLDFPNPNPILPPPLPPSSPPIYGSSPLISTTLSSQEEDKRSGFGFGVGESSTRKKIKSTCVQENECRVWKKREIVRFEMEDSEMVLLRDAKNIGCLDLELRLGRS